MNMKNFALILMSLLMVCCTKDDEVKAATVQEAGKTLVVYYSYTNNCHEIVTSLTSQIQADVMRIEPADKTQKYEANGYAIGTALLNAIKVAPNDAALAVPEHHHRHAPVVEPDGGYHADVPV